jgi:hypothetical protein
MTQSSAIVRARWMNCSINSTEIPCLRTRSRLSKTASTTIGARPSDISSAMSSFGETASARPSDSICCSPPERLPARWLVRRPRMGNISTAFSTAASRSAREPAWRTAIFRLSMTESPGKMPRPSGM